MKNRDRVTIHGIIIYIMAIVIMSQGIDIHFLKKNLNKLDDTVHDHYLEYIDTRSKANYAYNKYTYSNNNNDDDIIGYSALIKANNLEKRIAEIEEKLKEVGLYE